jgi:putative ABC transport system substrate-binding protein
MRFTRLKRREFITLIGGAAAAWPVVVRAQQPAMPAIGFLHSGTPGPYRAALPAFLAGLKESGYIEGQNVAIEYRWAEDQYNRLPAFVTEVIRRDVAVIFAGGGPAVRAAKAATATIPIVFTVGEDPVKTGLVPSLGRPGGNVTGVSLLFVELGAKRLELLRELLPNPEVIALLVNPTNATEAESQVIDARSAASAIGQQLIVFNASTEGEIEQALTTLVQQRVSALMVGSDFFLTTRFSQLVQLAARNAIPAIYPWREATVAGGLMSYGPIRNDSYRQAGAYVGQILKGAKPAELPVLQPTKFELLINLKTAKSLGLAVPIKLLAFADEVIE